ncbi:MAG TPA: hypothetical protein DCX07_00820 [Phycisphaerales bacterium]|nr:hypothetical protein [Phycisphaerales bacterium]
MKGYGLTVLSGQKIVRFDVEIVSVMTRWGPHQDVILANLSGLGLEKTGVIQGMSGSPCFVTDPADGKDKLIGAVAYGWLFQSAPLCGIQPITQMIAASGIVGTGKGATTAPASQPASEAAGAAGVSPPQAYLHALLNPRKGDFAAYALPKRPADGDDSDRASRLVPLTSPLMISGAGRNTVAQAAKLFAPLGLAAVQAGGAGTPDDARAGKLQPGSPLAVALVSGDADISAVGTVTDVVGERVLGFGHSLFSDGKVQFSMAPAYVHAVVASSYSSFKLASPFEPTGLLDRDEASGVAGSLGAKAPAVPMTVEVHWPQTGHRQTFRFRLVIDRWITAVLTNLLLYDAAWGWRNPPELHTVRHEVRIDFGALGEYRARNVGCNIGVAHAASDVSRPLAALLNNPFDPPVAPRAIEVRLEISEQARAADVLELALDGATYRPGDTVTGRLTVQPFRQARRELPVKFALPRNLPDGAYELTACDAYTAASAERNEMPHLFEPRSTAEMFAALQRVVRPDGAKLYLRLPVRADELAVGTREMSDLPPSKAAILRQSQPLDLFRFTRSAVRTADCEYVLNGSASAKFTVQAEPKETRLNAQ